MNVVNYSRCIHWLILGVFLTLMADLSGSASTVKNLLIFTMAAAVIITTGEIVMLTANLQTQKSWLPIATVTGISIISMAMLPFTVFLNYSAALSFTIVALLIFFLIFLLIFFPGFYSRCDLLNLPTVKKTDIAVFLLLTIIVALGAKIPAASMVSVHNGEPLPVWSDYYLHGMTLNSFGSLFSIGLGDPTLANTPIAFYHYGPFMLPAASMFFTGLSGAATATSILLPLGLLAGLLGLYALATELGGRVGGALFIVVLICFPAPVMFLKIGMYDFYWLLFASPGAGYAIGLSAIAIISFLRYLENKTVTLAMLTIILTLSIIMMRAHMFLLTAPMLIGALCIHLFPQWKIRFLGLFFSAVLFLVLLLAVSHEANQFWIKTTNVHDFMNFTLASNPYYQQLNAFISTHIHHGLFAAQTLLIVFSTFGVFILVSPVLQLLRLRYLNATVVDWLPWILLLSFTLLVVFAPIAANGDASEYRHRHFILAYPLYILFSVHFLLSLIYKTQKAPENTKLQLALLFSAAVFTMIYSWKHNPARPMLEIMPWANTLFQQEVSPGVIETSGYLTANSKPGEIFVANSAAAFPSLKGAVVEISAITGLSTFISRTELSRTSLSRNYQTFNDRLKIMKEIEHSADWDAARKILNTYNIRWYLHIDNGTPAFDRENRHGRKFDAIIVYDARTR